MSPKPLIAMVILACLAACSEHSKDHESAAEHNAMRQESDSTSAQPAQTATVTGLATYRERMALPPDASFEATLEDLSRADAPAWVIGRSRIDPAGQPPFRFSISYDPAQLQPNGNYAIRARVMRAGQLLFTTDRHYALPPAGESVELMLVGASQRAPGSASAASLENTYWQLMSLGEETITVAAEQREPHLVLHSEDNRVTGYGGCNRFAGSYSVSGEQLTFSQMAGTMMACPDGMQYEQAFHDALTKVASWKIEGERLELFDSAGLSLARFESRYMR